MTNREIDFTIHADVMGFGEIIVDGVPFYSTDIAAAWSVVEKLGHKHMLTIRTGGKIPKGATYHHGETTVTIEAELTRAESTAKAICLAALKAVGVEVDPS